MAQTVFAVEITLQDHASPVTALNSMGLYVLTSNLFANASSGQKDVTVVDGSIFEAGEKVTITDTNANEINVIDSIAGNILTMFNNLANTYTTAASAKVNGNSVLRWIQNSISGVSGWQDAMLIPDGIGSFSKRANLRRGGNTAGAGKCRVVVTNAGKFYNQLLSRTVFLNGMRLRVYEFVDTVKTLRWTGYITAPPTFDDMKYTISASTNITKRVSNILTQINKDLFPDSRLDQGGEAVSAAYGRFEPVFDADGNLIYDNYIKLKRTSDQAIELKNNTFEDFLLPYYDAGLKYFKLTAVNNDTGVYTVQISERFLMRDFPSYQTALTGMYMSPIEGVESGEFKKIASVNANDEAAGTIQFTVDDSFVTGVSVNEYIKIVDVRKGYHADFTKSGGFIDENGTVVEESLDLFIYNSSTKRFDRIARYLLETVTSDYFSVLVNARYYSGGIDSIDSFLILPVEKIEPFFGRGTGLNNRWGLSATWEEMHPGRYRLSTKPVIPDTPINTNMQTRPIDRDPTLFGELGLGIDWLIRDAEILFLVEFNLPKLPENFDFEKAYFLINSTFTETKVSGVNKTFDRTIAILTKRHFSTGINVIKHFKDGSVFVNSFKIDNIADFYYLTNKPSTRNQNFYLKQDDTLLLAGYQNSASGTGSVGAFELSGITSRDLYTAIDAGLLYQQILEVDHGAANYTHSLKLYELAIMFRSTVTIGDDLYSRFRGRVFNDTWGARKTATDLIEFPADLLEDFCRKQNWDENSIMPSEGWGKGYPENALIKLTGTGNFDNVQFKAWSKQYKCVRQIKSYNSGFTDKLKKSICEEFFLINYTDANGKECVERITKGAGTSSGTITIDDIVNRNRIGITEPNQNDIYPEPFVRFNINPETDEYQDIIKIKNVSAETFNASYVEAPDGLFAGNEAQEYWERSQALWNRSREKNEPPSSKTDLKYANGADGGKIAKEKLTNWIDWMSNYEVKLQTYYSLVKTWDVGTKFVLNLPHQTNSVNIDCRIEEIKKSPNGQHYCNIKAILFLEGIPELFNIQDTMDALGGTLDWEDDMDTLAQRGSGGDDVIDQT